ncbi:competence type IV pilus major pilin ComGC [Culicoidibacter larvae]|uniref:Prepilin-type N-terminal cleavage/methylation domain-containing protein n=1 Tax=Culicoidibacter larvae TaxID=2579976 RepID=A0A5R8QGD2_9FIRM|nr:competence type IV pilus major pilin ComGC [Culicoidibacter larvae]TLG76513.1 prepilin-type N-terminal cleavage/methylation domain-containing protein [Culicoidibacter larvae]
MKKKSGFTLIEMLIVMMVIVILLLLIIPNVNQHIAGLQSKGCDAYMEVVQAQVESYRLQHNATPSIERLVSDGYIKSATCQDGKALSIDSEGKVEKE